jgi:hypothetical protein
MDAVSAVRKLVETGCVNDYRNTHCINKADSAESNDVDHISEEVLSCLEGQIKTLPVVYSVDTQ